MSQDETLGIRDLAVELPRIRDVGDLPRDLREAIADVLGHECGQRGLDRDEEPNAYGRVIEALVESLGLDE